MPKPFPQEFRDDVVKVARSRPDGVTLERIAADFGIHPMTLSKWLRQAAVDDGDRPGVTTTESVELREARKRIRMLEMENEVLRRAAAYLGQANLPKGALRDQPGTAGSDARDLLSFAHGVGAAGEEDAEPVVVEVAEPST